MKSTFRKSTLALAVVAAVCAGSAFAASANNALVSVAQATTLRHGDAVSGVLLAAHPVHIEVALKLRNRDALDSFLKDSAKHPFVAKPMGRDQIAANHLPTQAQAQSVASYLTSMGYKNVVISANRMMVSADGTAATAQKAFSTSLAQVKTSNGRVAFVNTDAVRIPAQYQDTILAVLGLQTANQAHTFIKFKSKGGAHTDSIIGHNPTEFSKIYSADQVQTGAGIPIGIFAIGDVSQAITDLNTFTTNNTLAPVTTVVVPTNGGGTDTSGTDEWDLDSQDIVGMAGGEVGSLIFYNTPSFSDADLAANFTKIVGDNATKIINASFGGCELGAQETGLAATVDQTLALGVAQGQTFSISTGDRGADECGDGGKTPSWPANSPYAVAAAGTTLDADTTTWAGETVWGGSGGSPSTYEPKPSWQQVLVPGKFRGVADIAFDGDPNSGATIVFNGGTTTVGGTSLSAPLFSGMWARVLAVKGQDFGFAAPMLYQLPATDFHNVTTGNNGGESAKVGYDFASGRGSVMLNTAISHLGVPIGDPPVASFSWVTGGLNVHFTNTSTDDDGTIIKQFWNFGDGSATNLKADPVHAYPGAGTYNVTLSVADNDLNLTSVTHAIKVAPPAGAIKNTGFEDTTAWTFSSPSLRNNNAAEPPHAGSWDAWLGGQGKPHTDWVSQPMNIPAGKTSATLAFWLHIDSNEISTVRKFDKMTVGVYSTGGLLLGTLASFSNLDKAPGYSLHSYDVSAYIGQKVVLKFNATEDASIQTSFVIDDVTATAK